MRVQGPLGGQMQILNDKRRFLDFDVVMYDGCHEGMHFGSFLRGEEDGAGLPWWRRALQGSSHQIQVVNAQDGLKGMGRACRLCIQVALYQMWQRWSCDADSCGSSVTG